MLRGTLMPASGPMPIFGPMFMLISAMVSIAVYPFLYALSKETVRRVTAWALCIIVPTLVASLASLIVRGDRGFFSNSQSVVTGCVFLIVALGLSYLGICWRDSLPRRGLRGEPDAKLKPPLMDEELA